MVSANVLYMIWEQIVFQERRIFLFTPTREEQVWVGGSEGVPWAQICHGHSVGPGGRCHLPQNTWSKVPMGHLRAGQTHSSVGPHFIPPGFSRQNRRQGMDEWMGRVCGPEREKEAKGGTGEAGTHPT